ncbi:MAG: PhzF family phenazine biosynthesis protein [Phycisphaerales bacterium]|nr:PhzF family phenazine biosynthesis protein [Phycisphaerales bacterium]MCB9836303.1 PhzF family phenazine biosynthesis protein [Phycisphaera sp.]
MKLQIFQVDAFASRLFSGNPAAVVPLDSWLDDKLLQSIAIENNLSETAYIIATLGAETDFHIRWFTPGAEVSLCGHATLATAHTLWNHLGFTKDRIVFDSLSGPLNVSRDGDLIQLDFPLVPMSSCEPSKELVKALGAKPIECHSGRDVLCLFENESDVLSLKPDFAALAAIPDGRAVMVTALGSKSDFVSRFFAPRVGVNEDPVTGSAHCALTPYWAEKLCKTRMKALQLSPRGGELECELAGDRVLLRGRAVTFMTGTIEI